MPLHPDAEPFVALMQEHFPDLGGAVTDAAEARTLMADGAADRPRPPVAKVADRRIPGPPGVEIPVRIYWPSVDGDPLPVVVFFHGGGWVLGDLESHDGTARALANGSGAIVIAVHYRLAPEHRYPAAAEDCYAATRWAAEHAAELGGDPTRLAVAGDSAGGNLAAVTALLAAERGGPQLTFQLLIYPVTDHDFTNESYLDSAPDCLLTKGHMVWFWDQYVPDVADRNQPYASPLRAEDLAGLPPAHVLTVGRDPLRTEGQRYAERLQEAGVPTTVQHCPGLFHGFAGGADEIPVAAEAMAEVHKVLREALKAHP
ncbi:alpha/beta hydrolase [Saccharopolyspora sp. K220]|uniref:alpha/beta hydrolase n=1 Tax=Saccharopolyspora soli TaxID=2926618 RepID=UPI001F59C021|nr:alpha/beta hydrolase [Saccharopolyspora soli]MCI2417615.1 alpha/beta hydrolase [Saccharopolyspora soli]